jgi:hypothetical protein
MDMFVRFKGLCLFQKENKGKAVEVTLVDVTKPGRHRDDHKRDKHYPRLVVVNPHDMSTSKSIVLKDGVTFKLKYRKGRKKMAPMRASDLHLLPPVTVDPKAKYHRAEGHAARLRISEGRVDPHLLVKPSKRGEKIVFNHSDDGTGNPVTRESLAYEMLWEVNGLERIEVWVGAKRIDGKLDPGKRRLTIDASDGQRCVDLVIGNLCNKTASRWGEFVMWDECKGGVQWEDRDFRAFFDLCRGVDDREDLAYPVIGTEKPNVIPGPSFSDKYRHYCANVLVRGQQAARPKPLVSMGAPTCLNGCGGQC